MINNLILDGKIVFPVKDLPVALKGITIYDVRNCIARHSHNIKKYKKSNNRETYIDIEGFEYLLSKYKKKIKTSIYLDAVAFLEELKEYANNKELLKDLSIVDEEIENEPKKDNFNILIENIIKSISQYDDNYDFDKILLENKELKKENIELKEKMKNIELSLMAFLRD